jgi:hypothetical protein
LFDAKTHSSSLFLDKSIDLSLLLATSSETSSEFSFKLISESLLPLIPKFFNFLLFCKSIEVMLLLFNNNVFNLGFSPKLRLINLLILSDSDSRFLFLVKYRASNSLPSAFNSINLSFSVISISLSLLLFKINFSNSLKSLKSAYSSKFLPERFSSFTFLRSSNVG